MSAHMPGCKYDPETKRYTTRAEGCAAPEEHDDARTCADCGYDEGLHRAYAMLDSGRPDGAAHLGGFRHRFRAAPAQTEDRDA